MRIDAACERDPPRESSHESAGGSDVAVAKAVANLKRQRIFLLALDFDLTIVDIHTGGKWRRDASELAKHVRPFWPLLISQVMAQGICVAVVTMSPQSDLIHEVLMHILPMDVVKRIVIRGSDGGWQARCGGAVGCGKQAHIASALEELKRMDQCSGGKPDGVVLVDDDAENVAAATRGAMHAVWCPADCYSGRSSSAAISDAVLSSLAVLPHHDGPSPGVVHNPSPPPSPVHRSMTQSPTLLSSFNGTPGAAPPSSGAADKQGLILTPNGWRLGESSVVNEPSPRSPSRMATANGISLGLPSAPQAYRSPLSPPHSPIHGTGMSSAGRVPLHGAPGYMASSRVALGSGPHAHMSGRSSPGLLPRGHSPFVGSPPGSPCGYR